MHGSRFWINAITAYLVTHQDDSELWVRRLFCRQPDGWRWATIREGA